MAEALAEETSINLYTYMYITKVAYYSRLFFLHHVHC